MSETNAKVQHIIDRFVAELTQVAREQAASVLLTGLNTSRPGRQASGKASGSDRGRKRSPERLEATKQKLVAFVTSHPGLRTEEINRQLGTTTKDLALPMRQLVAKRLIKTTGTRRATRYFAGGAKPAKPAKPTRPRGKKSRRSKR